jgi:branched-chain amino acid aminotransferase
MISPPEPLAFINGEFLPYSAAHLALHDAGFVFGATVSDLCRTFRHQLFRLPDHLLRFADSCRAVGIDLGIVPSLSDPLTDLTAAAEHLVTNNAALLANPEQELILVLFATPGPLAHYLGQPSGLGIGTPTIGMHTMPLSFARYAGFFREGIQLVIPLTRHIPRRAIPANIKHRSRLHWWLAEQEAQQLTPGSVALLLGTDGHVTETALANFVIVRRGVVLSPPRTSILRGISLQVVEELCFEMGIPFREQPLNVGDCLTADEAMLCGTAFCLAGVRSIDSQLLPWPGPIFERLLAAWNGQAGLDIRAQFLRGG